MKNKKKKGFTSIELLISVGVISVLSSAAYFLYDAISDKRQVLTELKNVELLIGALKNATIASTYQSLSKEKLFDYGIVFNSSFPTYDIKGINHKSFEISYKDLNSRQCTDFALKSAAYKGDFVLTRKVNNKVVNQSPAQIADECSNNLNEIVLSFSGLIVPDIAQVTPGTPKPPPFYAQPGSFVPALPDRGDVPTNLASALKPVSTPSAPTKGTYVPPTYVVSNPKIVNGGDIFETGGYVKPVYNDTPPPPVTSGTDDTEFRPEVPTPPPPPPALPPPPPPDQVTLNFNKVCHTLSVTGLEQPSCSARSGSYDTKISSFNGENFRKWALGFGPSICPYPYSANFIIISLNDLDSFYQAFYSTNSWFPPFIPTSSLEENPGMTNKGLLSITIYCSGFN